MVPGGAAYVGAVLLPGGCVVLGVVPSEIRTNENPSIHMGSRTGVMLPIITLLALVDADVLRGSPCALSMVGHTSYITDVSEAQNHVYEEGNDARVGGEATKVGVRRGGGRRM